MIIDPIHTQAGFSEDAQDRAIALAACRIEGAEFDLSSSHCNRREEKGCRRPIALNPVSGSFKRRRGHSPQPPVVAHLESGSIGAHDVCGEVQIWR